MSDQQVLVGKRKINRLNLDSDEEAKQEAEEKERQEEIRLKKEEKRRKREEEARKIEEEEKKQKELELHYGDPHTMMEPDSDSEDAFERIQKKIKKAFPDFKHSRQQTHRHRNMSESQELDQSDSEDEDSQQSEEESSEAPRRKKEKKVAKKERKQGKREESQQLRASRHRVEKVKVQEKDPKELLVGEVAVRWWYCLPEWPPADFDYQAQLKKLGYRLVDSSRFRMEENLVNGLYKATPVDGFVGIFKSKLKIIDVRPRDSCPSLQLLRSKTIDELSQLLKTALKEQINSLNSQKYQGSEDLELITKLSRRLNEIEV